MDPESHFGVADIKYEVGAVEYNISYDHEMRVKAATLIKIIEWITSHTQLPEQRNACQETPEEYESRCFLNVYKLLKDQHNDFLTAGMFSYCRPRSGVVVSGWSQVYIC